MARKVNPGPSGNLEWSEKVVHPEGSSMSISLQLDAVDQGSGFSSDGRDSSEVSWLSFSTQENTLPDGSLEKVVTIAANEAQLSKGNLYRFSLFAYDGDSVSAQKTDLTVRDPRFYNISGQEDKYRSENGTRVQRGGIARVVATTTEETSIDIKYAENPSNEDNPTLNNQILDASSGTKYHEFFFGVDPSSLYAFKLYMKPGGTTVESDLFYLATGDTIQIEASSFGSSNGVEIVSSILKNEELINVGQAGSSRITQEPESLNINISQPNTKVTSSANTKTQNIIIEPLKTSYTIS